MFQIKSPHTKDNWWVFSQDDVNYINQVSSDYLTDFLGFVLVEPAPNTKPMHRLKSIHTKDTWMLSVTLMLNMLKRNGMNSIME